MSGSQLLDSISVASPCPVAWETMSGTGRVRFCSQCRQHVYDLSRMSRVEAEALAHGKEDRLCVRFYRRADGTMMTKDCPAGWRGLRRRLVLALSLVITLGLAIFGWTIANAASSEQRTSWLRQVEPFRTVLEWIDPSPPMIMGKR